ncbi:MAG: hypothetical protein AAF631_12965 [Pseudomonadota bacterium]
MILRAIVFFLWAGAAAACQAVPDRADEREVLLGNLREAPDAGAASDAVRAMWQFWFVAPDTTAQELLDAGTEAIRYGDFSRAELVLGRLTGYCPAYAEGWNQFAYAYFLQRRDDLSKAALEQALALEPAHFGALSGMALIAIRAGDKDAAKRWFRRSLEVHPWSGERAILEQLEGETDL